MLSHLKTTYYTSFYFQNSWRHSWPSVLSFALNFCSFTGIGRSADQLKFDKSMNYVRHLRLFRAHAISAVFVSDVCKFISNMHFFWTHILAFHILTSSQSLAYKCTPEKSLNVFSVETNWQLCFFAPNVKVVCNWILWLTVLRLIQPSAN